jgi:hypothetical protein
MSMADRPSSSGWRGPGMREFVALMAALMASNALAIDSMLPALPAIGEALGVAEENRRQLVITVYLIGFGRRSSSTGRCRTGSGARGCWC